jgi:predicted dehydrogenase
MPVRVGLIGCGIISGAHLDAWQACAPRGRIVAVADPDPEKANRAAEKAPGARVFTDHRALLADPDIDAVDLCLPHHLHRAVTEEALTAGKHVLCEKPIANTLAEADAMIAAAERAGRVLLIAEQMRYEGTVPAARARLAAGDIGEVLVAQATMGWFQGGVYLQSEWRLDAVLGGGGALIDGGHHWVDLLLNLLGEPKEVTAMTRRVRPCYGGEDIAVVTARFASGVVGTLTVCSSTHRYGTPIFVIMGTEGQIVGYWDRIEVRAEGLPDGRLEQPIERRHGFQAEMNDFLDAVLDGAVPKSGGREARADLAFILAAYESAATGVTVRL